MIIVGNMSHGKYAITDYGENQYGGKSLRGIFRMIKTVGKSVTEESEYRLLYYEFIFNDREIGYDYFGS